MEQFPAPLTRPESDFVFEQIEAGFKANGFGIWCVEQLDGTFLGLTGISVVPFEEHFTPAVEVGWRLLPQAGVTATRPRRDAKRSATASRWSA